MEGLFRIGSALFPTREEAHRLEFILRDVVTVRIPTCRKLISNIQT